MIIFSVERSRVEGRVVRESDENHANDAMRHYQRLFNLDSCSSQKFLQARWPQ
jgi:hypothetical protein